MNSLLSSLTLGFSPPKARAVPASPPALKRATKVTPLRWRMATGVQIELPIANRRKLSGDWDVERLRCWGSARSARTQEQTEVLVAEVICAGLAVLVGIAIGALS